MVATSAQSIELAVCVLALCSWSWLLLRILPTTATPPAAGAWNEHEGPTSPDEGAASTPQEKPTVPGVAAPSGGTGSEPSERTGQVERSIEALLQQAGARRQAALPRARLAVMARSFAGRAAAIEAAFFCQLLALAGTGIDLVR